jgi:hypothetical protein
MGARGEKKKARWLDTLRSSNNIDGTAKGLERDRKQAGAKGAHAEKIREIMNWLNAALAMTESQDNIEISRSMATDIVAILNGLPAGKFRRPKLWTPQIELFAILDMLDGTPVDQVARAIHELTGQAEDTADRRLNELKNMAWFKSWKRG